MARKRTSPRGGRAWILVAALAALSTQPARAEGAAVAEVQPPSIAAPADQARAPASTTSSTTAPSPSTTAPAVPSPTAHAVPSTTAPADSPEPSPEVPAASTEPAASPEPAATDGSDPATAPASATPGAQPSSSVPTSTVPAPPAPEAHDKVATNVPSLLTQTVAPEKEQWEALHGGFIASRLAIRRRMTAVPDRLLVEREDLPRDREDFLWRVARDTWAGIEAMTDNDNGLVMDNVAVVGNPLPPLKLQIGDYTNITNVGLHLAAIVAARRLGLVPDREARITLLRILDTLAGLRRHDGYFFNYYDTTSLEPTSTFLSFVDTSWLMAGLMIARQGFPEFEHAINDLLEPIDLHRFYDDSTGLMSHGYYVNLGTLSAYEYGTFYTEARLGSLIAIGKGDAPVRHWYAMQRAAQPGCMEGECPKLHRLEYRNSHEEDMSVWYYRWRSYQYVPSWGGSMFEALMPRLVLDESRFAPRSLGPNGHAHALLQKHYATDVLGYPVWGMSPCITPSTGRYREFGVRGLGNHGYDESVVTPHAAALALAVAPDDAADALMDMARLYDIYGPFGFYDSVEPATGRVAYHQLALDQLMLFLSVANHLSGGEVPALFAEDPWIKDALPLLAEERFFR